jgi:hypothetical protein
MLVRAAVGGTTPPLVEPVGVLDEELLGEPALWLVPEEGAVEYEPPEAEPLDVDPLDDWLEDPLEF